jgi:hypothetical protein
VQMANSKQRQPEALPEITDRREAIAPRPAEACCFLLPSPFKALLALTCTSYWLGAACCMLSHVARALTLFILTTPPSTKILEERCKMPKANYPACFPSTTQRTQSGAT